MMINKDFEHVYDKYCPMLYCIAIEICNSQIHAEELLLNTFKKIRKEDISQKKYPAYTITLIHLIIKTSKDLPSEKIKSDLRLKQFENTPLINQLICEQKNLHDYSKEKHLTQQDCLQIIRKEFNVIKKSEIEKK